MVPCRWSACACGAAGPKGGVYLPFAQLPPFISFVWFALSSTQGDWKAADGHWNPGGWGSQSKAHLQNGWNGVSIVAFPPSFYLLKMACYAANARRRSTTTCWAPTEPLALTPPSRSAWLAKEKGVCLLLQSVAGCTFLEVLRRELT